MEIFSKIIIIVSVLTIAACSKGQSNQPITEKQNVTLINYPTIFPSSTPDNLPTWSLAPNSTRPKATASPTFTFTKSLANFVLQSSNTIQLLGEANISEFVFKEATFPEPMNIEIATTNHSNTVNAFVISACSYCDYHADKHDNLICQDLAKSYRDTSDEDGLNLCVERLFFENTATKQLYELDWLRLGYRPITNLVWVDNDVVAFHIWAQPYFGRGYVFDFKQQKFLFVGIIADKSW